VGVLALPDPEALPVAEVVFRPPAGSWPILTYAAKWAEGSDEDRASPVRCPAEIDEALADRVGRLAVAAFRATGSTMSLSHYHGYFAEIHWKAGRPHEALRELDEALQAVERSNNRFYEAELHRLRGEALLAAADDRPAAEACFKRALAVARDQRAKSWELRAAMSLCRLRSRQGKATEGQRQLVEVYRGFTEGFATPDLVEARALLAE